MKCDKVFYICTEKRAFEILSFISIITLPMTVSARGCIDIRENWQTQAIEPIRARPFITLYKFGVPVDPSPPFVIL